MQNRKIRFTPKNIIMYFSGFIITALGVIFMLRGNLGAGAWDTVTANLNEFLASVDMNLTLGTTSMIITFTLMLIVLVYTRKWQLIGMVIPVGIMALAIDFWDIIVFGDYVPTVFMLRALFFMLGALIIPLGLAIVVSSHFPAFVFDELTIVVMDLFRTKSITKARLGIEFLGISLGVLFGFLASIGFGAVNIGSLVMAVILPPIFNFFVKKIGAFDE
jgi:uncharacterized membrane protein YczE